MDDVTRHSDPLARLSRSLLHLSGSADSALAPTLWEESAERELHKPANLPPPRQRRLVLPRRRGLAAWLARFLRWLRIVRPRIIRKETGSITDLLTRAHLSLAHTSLTRLMPWFETSWVDVPASLMSISEQGVVWALAATHLKEESHAGFADTIAGLSSIPAAAMTAGDCVAIHFLFEDVVATLPQRCKFNVPSASARVAGGLRSPETLRILPALREADPAWHHAIELLARTSPLTQLVYADLLDWRDGKASPSAAALFRPAPGVAGDDLDLWTSHLARSLIAALYSRAPSDERRREAQRQLERSRASAPRRADGSVPLRVERAQRRVHDLDIICHAEYWPRMAAVAEMTGHSPFFRIRFLDMLIRRVVSDCAGEMRAWSSGGRKVEPRTHFFYDDRAACRLQLERVLWEQPGAVPGRSRPAMATAWSSLHVRSLEADAVADGAFPAAATNALLARFQRSIPLPIPNAADAHPPARIWSHWWPLITNRLGQTTETEESE